MHSNNPVVAITNFLPIDEFKKVVTQLILCSIIIEYEYEKLVCATDFKNEIFAGH